MKRLLAAGSGDIYQLCRVFRDDELGRWHQPEFTLLEWYRVGWDEQRLMSEVAELIAAALSRRRPGRKRAADSVRLTLCAGARRRALGAAARRADCRARRRLARARHRRAAGPRARRRARSRVRHRRCSRASTPARADVRLRLSGEPGGVGAREADDAAGRGAVRGVQRRHRARQRLSRARRMPSSNAAGSHASREQRRADGPARAAARRAASCTRSPSLTRLRGRRARLRSASGARDGSSDSVAAAMSFAHGAKRRLSAAGVTA